MEIFGIEITRKSSVKEIYKKDYWLNKYRIMKREVLAVIVFAIWISISMFSTFKTGLAGFWLITDFVMACALYQIFKYR